MDLGIKGRRALVGGASSGLGRAVAFGLAAEGCRLAISSRSRERLEVVAEELEAQFDTRVVILEADANDPGGAANLAAGATAALGGVDILVLNAGGPPPVDATATSSDAWAKAFQLLATTPIELATRLLPGMREARWGRIVSIMSYSVRQPVPELAYSTGGRSALMAWMKTVARAVAADGVTVNGVLPGRHETARIAELDRARAEATGRSEAEVRAGHVAGIPAGRYGTAEELASLVVYLCSEPARFQTGTFTAVDGGLLAGLP
ncbi:MAG TPA: SDR family oxidoreductase [Candidatus Limnocylindrales bacterium]